MRLEVTTVVSLQLIITKLEVVWCLMCGAFEWSKSTHLTISSRSPCCSCWVLILTLRRLISVSRLLAVRRISWRSGQISVALDNEAWKTEWIKSSCSDTLRLYYYHIMNPQHNDNEWFVLWLWPCHLEVTVLQCCLLPVFWSCSPHWLQVTECWEDVPDVFLRSVFCDACSSSPPGQSYSARPV